MRAPPLTPLIWPPPHQVGLERREPAADHQAPQLADAGLMLINPSPLRNGQAVRGARQTDRFVLTRRLKGLEHGSQALTTRRGQTEAGFPGRHLSWE
jgi:hypothetical protein